MKEMLEAGIKAMVKTTKAKLTDLVSTTDVKLDPALKLEAKVIDGVYHVVIPQEMDLLQASFSLLQRFEEEEKYQTFNLQFKNVFLNDVILTMKKVIPDFFGKIINSSRDTQGDRVTPANISFIVDYKENGEPIHDSGFLGSVVGSIWEDAIIDINPGGLSVLAKKKYERQIEKFFDAVKDYMKKNSVVKGHAVTVRQVRQGLIADPVYVKTNTRIVLNEDTRRIVNNLVIPSLGEKQKKTLLFTGDFGTGKTETAIRVGIHAKNDHGRTFFYLHNSNMFEALIPYIKEYGPACVFVEDIDQVTSGDRDSSMNDLLNQMDGSELKYVDCVFIFTTNNHRNIHPAMRRPGRIDQVVHFDYCTKDSIIEIYKIYAEGMKGAVDVDYVDVAENTPDKIQGAIVAEIAKRAVKYAEQLHGGRISTDTFKDAIASLKHHIEFMREDQIKDNSLEQAVKKLFVEGAKAVEEADLG